MPKFIEKYHVIDKRIWGDGPWVGEPDKVVWVDKATDLDCMIVRNRAGALCGYVGVSNEHPFYGKQMLDTPILHVHGGVTFASGCVEEGDHETSVCHNPQPGRTSDIWWLGFDCCHAWDIAPAMDAQMNEIGLGLPPMDGLMYRDINYVIDQCEALATQVKEVEHGMGSA